MANTLTAAIPKIIARSLEVLRQNAVTPRLVNTGYSVDPKGNTVTIPVSASQAVTDVTPAAANPSNVDHVMTNKSVVVDTWKKSFFHLDDSEVTEINENDHWRIPQLDEAVKAIANNVDAAVLALYKDVYNRVGTAGTTPFASSAQFATDFTKGARKKLQDGLAPQGDRYCVLDTAAEGNILSLDQFTNLQNSGRDEGIIEGQMGRRFGTDWWMNQNIPTHTRGVPVAGTQLEVDGLTALGATSLTLQDSGGSLTGDINEGDVFTIAGDTQQYVVTADASAAANKIACAFSPALVTAAADEADVTWHTADSVENLYFHREAFALVSKMPQDMSGLGRIVPVVDPVTGLVFRLEVRRDHKQTTFELDYRYGVETIRPEFACRISG